MELDFKTLKDNVAIGAVLWIFAWHGTQLQKLSNTAEKLSEQIIADHVQVAENVKQINNHRIELNQHSEKISEVRSAVSRHDGELAALIRKISY